MEKPCLGCSLGPWRQGDQVHSQKGGCACGFDLDRCRKRAEKGLQENHRGGNTGSTVDFYVGITANNQNSHLYHFNQSKPIYSNLTS